MQYFLIFLVELGILFFLSRFLTKTLSHVLLLITRSRKVTVTITALLFFPGVVIHELSHMLTAGILFVPVGDINLMPKLRENGELRLGSVMIGSTDIIRRAIIGLAPLLVGLVIILGVPFALQGQTTILYSAVVVYILFEVGNTMFSSNKDLEGMAELVIVLGLLVLAFYIANFRIPLDAFSSFLSRESSIQFFKQVNNFLLWTLVIDVVAMVFLKLVSLVTYKGQIRS